MLREMNSNEKAGLMPGFFLWRWVNDGGTPMGNVRHVLHGTQNTAPGK